MEATTLCARLQSQLYTHWARATALWHIYRIVLNLICPRYHDHYRLVFDNMPAISPTKCYLLLRKIPIWKESYNQRFRWTHGRAFTHSFSNSLVIKLWNCTPSFGYLFIHVAKSTSHLALKYSPILVCLFKRLKLFHSWKTLLRY